VLQGMIGKRSFQKKS